MASGFGQQCGTAGQLCRELALAGVELLISSGKAKALAGGATMLANRLAVADVTPR